MIRVRAVTQAFAPVCSPESRQLLSLARRLSQRRKPRQTAANCAPNADFAELRAVAEAAADAGAKVQPPYRPTFCRPQYPPPYELYRPT